jgi:hypothetical protein
MSEITVVGSADRTGWAPLTDAPGRPRRRGVRSTSSRRATKRSRAACGNESPTRGHSSGRTTRSPTSWRIADVEADDGRVLHLGAGDIFVTPKGSKGTWRIHETVAKMLHDLHGRADR